VELPTSPGRFSLTLVSNTGKPVLQQAGTAGETVKLPVQTLPKGLYLLRIEHPGGTATRKVVVQ
jgi:hypothetical protein